MGLRLFAGLVYLLATALWAFYTAMAQALRCDDGCTAAQFARDWHDNVDSWQYGVVGWLGAAGLALAVLAVALSFLRRWLGLAALVLHGAVFTANCLSSTRAEPSTGRSYLLLSAPQLWRSPVLSPSAGSYT